jgi:hypothetical protein
VSARRRLGWLVGLAVLVACEAPKPPPPPEPVDAGPPPASDLFEALRIKAEAANDAGSWRRYADALAHAGRREEAVSAYGACALNAGADFEASLYCQAAAAVAKKVKAPRDGGT